MGAWASKAWFSVLMMSLFSFIVFIIIFEMNYWYTPDRTEDFASYAYSSAWFFGVLSVILFIIALILYIVGYKYRQEVAKCEEALANDPCAPKTIEVCNPCMGKTSKAKLIDENFPPQQQFIPGSSVVNPPQVYNVVQPQGVQCPTKCPTKCPPKPCPPKCPSPKPSCPSQYSQIGQQDTNGYITFEEFAVSQTVTGMPQVPVSTVPSVPYSAPQGNVPYGMTMATVPKKVTFNNEPAETRYYDQRTYGLLAPEGYPNATPPVLMSPIGSVGLQVYESPIATVPTTMVYSNTAQPVMSSLNPSLGEQLTPKLADSIVTSKLPSMTPNSGLSSPLSPSLTPTPVPSPITRSLDVLSPRTMY